LEPEGPDDRQFRKRKEAWQLRREACVKGFAGLGVTLSTHGVPDEGDGARVGYASPELHLSVLIAGAGDRAADFLRWL
jgi:hypothetical protein